MKKFILAFLALTIILSSCSIEKRIHTPGYHIKWNKSNQNFDRQNLTNNNDEKKSDENYFYTDEKKDSITILSGMTDDKKTIVADTLLELSLVDGNCDGEEVLFQGLLLAAIGWKETNN